MELWKSASSLIGRHKFKLEGIEHFSKKMIDEWNTKAKLKARKTDEWKYRRGKKNHLYTHTHTRTKKYWMHMIFQCCRFLFDGFLSLMKSHLSRASTYFRESCSQRIQNMIISVNDCVHFLPSLLSLLVSADEAIFVWAIPSHSEGIQMVRFDRRPYRQWNDIIQQSYELCAYFMLSLHFRSISKTAAIH